MTTNQAPKTLRPFIETLQVGDPLGHLGLTLVPLRGERRGQLDYLLSMEALTAGTLAITEVSEGGSVPELLAVNQGQQMLLLLDGEELVGAKQNRILNTSVLLPAQSKTRIPVSCVEQGRWRHISHEFAPGSYRPIFAGGQDGNGDIQVAPTGGRIACRDRTSQLAALVLRTGQKSAPRRAKPR